MDTFGSTNLYSQDFSSCPKDWVYLIAYLEHPSFQIDFLFYFSCENTGRSLWSALARQSFLL